MFKEDIGLGGVVSLLWFKRRLPPWATKFIEMVLMLTADHGPAVSGYVRLFWRGGWLADLCFFLPFPPSAQ